MGTVTTEYEMETAMETEELCKWPTSKRWLRPQLAAIKMELCNYWTVLQSDGDGNLGWGREVGDGDGMTEELCWWPTSKRWLRR